jgi:hypothetical protein
MIEHVSEKLLFPFQFAYIIWPLFIFTALAYSLQFSRKRGWLRSLGKKIHTNLLVTWLALFVIWAITLLAWEPTPTLIPEPANSLLFFGGLAVLVAIEALRLRALPRRIRARIDLHEAQAVAYLRNMDPGAFEELVAETYRALGNTAWRVGKSGDHGVDVEVRAPRGERWIVQCKRYRDSVGESIVRELYGTLISEGAERAVLITSANITTPAETWARDKPIDLVDGPGLLDLIERARRRAAGSPFDRFTGWLEGLFRPARRPAILRPVAAGMRAGLARPGLLSHPDAGGASAGSRGAAGVRVAGPRPGALSPAEATRRTRVVRSPAVGLPSSNNGRELGAPAPPQLGRTQPVRVRPAAPRVCPRCGARLEPHPTRPGRDLYRCSRYPRCRVVLDG